MWQIPKEPELCVNTLKWNLLNLHCPQQKNANAQLLVSCLPWQAKLKERGDRQEKTETWSGEKHLQCDLNGFTCCLCHILKGKKAAVWTQCSLLRPRTQSGQREGEQLARSGRNPSSTPSPRENLLPISSVFSLRFPPVAAVWFLALAYES